MDGLGELFGLLLGILAAVAYWVLLGCLVTHLVLLGILLPFQWGTLTGWGQIVTVCFSVASIIVVLKLAQATIKDDFPILLLVPGVILALFQWFMPGGMFGGFNF